MLKKETDAFIISQLGLFTNFKYFIRIPNKNACAGWHGACPYKKALGVAQLSRFSWLTITLTILYRNELP